MCKQQSGLSSPGPRCWLWEWKHTASSWERKCKGVQAQSSGPLAYLQNWCFQRMLHDRMNAKWENRREKGSKYCIRGPAWNNWKSLQNTWKNGSDWRPQAKVTLGREGAEEVNLINDCRTCCQRDGCSAGKGDSGWRLESVWPSPWQGRETVCFRGSWGEGLGELSLQLSCWSEITSK